jgi:hypothetical protein
MNMANITPINYEIEFEPLFHNFTFNGTEIITLDISKPTNLIPCNTGQKNHHCNYIIE